MSFYGTIYNQISNAFDTFYVQNTGKDKKDFLSTTTNSMNIKADGREGELKLDTGNKWIQLQGNATDNFCKIYHSIPDSSDTTTNLILEKITDLPSGVEPMEVDLKNNVYFKINNVEYDKAGHISKSNNSYLKFKLVDASADIANLTSQFESFKTSTSETVNNAVNIVNGYDTRLKTVESDLSSAKDNINNLKKAVGVWSGDETITQVVGDISKVRESNDTFSGKSLSDILQLISNQVALNTYTLGQLVGG